MASEPQLPVRFYNLKQASAELNIKYWFMLSAANQQLFPVYRIGKRNRCVLLSEVVAALKGARA